jgi:hypothetical protein
VNGFIQLKRSAGTQELLARDPLAFALLTQIALRARWRSEPSMDDLEPREALIGDFENYGMTRREYRTRVGRLVKWLKIAVRTTPKGTIARLISTDVFDINEQSGKNRPSERPSNFREENSSQRPTERPTGGQQAANRRPLTNNDRRKERKKNQDESTALGNSAPLAPANGTPKSVSFFDGHQHQPIQHHVKFPEFAAWCRSQGGAPTEEGFKTWLIKQKPQWRSNVKGTFNNIGYELDGKFLTAEEANRMGRENPELLTQFRKAVKRNSKIQIIRP